MDIQIERAVAADLGTILDLQKRAFSGEADLYGACSVPPLRQTPEELEREFAQKVFLKATCSGVIVGSVRGALANGVCSVEKLIVDPQYQDRGIGTRLMLSWEREFPLASRFELVTGHKSVKNIHLYQKLGYVIVRQERKTGTLDFVYMVKKRS